MKPIGLFKRGGRVPNSFFFEKPNETMFFRSAFHADFLGSIIPLNSLEEKFCSLEFYSESK